MLVPNFYFIFNKSVKAEFTLLFWYFILTLIKVASKIFSFFLRKILKRRSSATDS